MNILAINSGSSSLKFKLVEIDESSDGAESRQPGVRFEGSVEDIGSAARLSFRRAGTTILANRRAVATHAEAVQSMMQMLEESSRREGRTLGIEAI